MTERKMGDVAAKFVAGVAAVTLPLLALEKCDEAADCEKQGHRDGVGYVSQDPATCEEYNNRKNNK